MWIYSMFSDATKSSLREEKTKRCRRETLSPLGRKAEEEERNYTSFVESPFVCPSPEWARPFILHISIFFFIVNLVHMRQTVRCGWNHSRYPLFAARIVSQSYRMTGRKSIVAEHHHETLNIICFFFVMIFSDPFSAEMKSKWLFVYQFSWRALLMFASAHVRARM